MPPKYTEIIWTHPVVACPAQSFFMEYKTSNMTVVVFNSSE